MTTHSHGKRKPPDLTPIVDAGREYFKRDPEALLASIYCKAAAQYASKDDQLAFVEGYQQARLQHDDYKNERATAVPEKNNPT